MKENFIITGLFYQVDNHKFRKYLNIKRKNIDIETPDLMVIMMNPGSSEPIDKNDYSGSETVTKPDPTQNQIMLVMNECGFNYARVFNLSDLKEPKCKIFYKKIPEFIAHNIPHSIFDSRRNEEFDNLFIRQIPIILAWGVNKKLNELAKKALDKIGIENTFGIKKTKTEFAYYHPLPPNNKKQKEWVEKITSQIKGNPIPNPSNHMYITEQS